MFNWIQGTATFKKKFLEMVSKKGGVRKNRVSRSCKVCVSSKCFIDTNADEKNKRPEQETS